MTPADRLHISNMKRPRAAILITLALVVVVTLLDYTTGPLIDFSVVYFLPITYAAWALGRRGALSVAVIAEVPTCIDHLVLLNLGAQDVLQAVSSMVVRFLVYVFVAEVTVRLAQSYERTRQAAEELADVNAELRTTYARLDEDVAAGGSLQQALLSFSPPSVPGCEVGAQVRNAWKVGGDFIDSGVIDDKLYVCVADISGKGTPAALFTALLKYLLNDAHRRGLRGGRVVSYLNRALCSGLPEERFVTLIYAEIDPETGWLHYSNAGHLEGLIFRRRTGVVDLLRPTAPILGVTERFPEDVASSVRLDTGDVLVLYTDGATESKLVSGERIGEARFREIVAGYVHLGVGEMAERICERVHEETMECCRDDVAVVCVRMTGVPVALSAESAESFWRLLE